MVTVDSIGSGKKVNVVDTVKTLKTSVDTDVQNTVTKAKETAEKINKAKKEGRPILAVGTTSVRTLESAGASGVMQAGGNFTQIFIYPGYKYKIVDCLITNFHLPKSTLIMLVSALYDREKVLEAYKEAVNEKYHFFSYGDAMFIE